MKLFPPEPKVDLYKEGFGTDDFLNRKPTGEALSHLVERIEDPLVIVLDGPWGSGKSYFLKRWVGAHAVENDGKATTVYFDAFANDFLDDPLTGLAGAISERLPADTKPKAKRALKGAVATLARPALRMGLAAATAGITEIAGSLVDAAVAAGSGEVDKAVDNFWKREEGRREAMRQVEQSLAEITRAEDETPRKLAIVVDELDRCRPDYALAVLETIKHFFAAPNVHFVLGVNMAALEHSVRARYGSQMDAEGYLRRFISITMSFPKDNIRNRGRSDASVYWLHQGRKMGLPQGLLDVVDRQLLLAGMPGNATIRDINRLLSTAVLMPNCQEFDRWRGGYQIVIASMLVAKALNPFLFQQMRRRTASVTDIRDFYGISDRQLNPESRTNGQYNHTALMLVSFWKFLFSSDSDEVDEQIARSFDGFTTRPSEVDIDRLAKDHFDTFAFSQGEQHE